jgi:hypothetical protein
LTMSLHNAWSLVCRLLAAGTPVLRVTMNPREIAVLPSLERAVKPATVDTRFVVCPACHQHQPRVWSDGDGGRFCQCPRCGPVAVTDNDVAALALDEAWLRQQLRVALGVDGCDGVDDLGDGVWRLGDARRSPVLLARSLIRLWREPAVLERVRVGGGDIRVIAPKPLQTCGAPFGPGVQWLALEDRFTWDGHDVGFIASAGPREAAPAAHPGEPVNGPFRPTSNG